MKKRMIAVLLSFVVLFTGGLSYADTSVKIDKVDLGFLPSYYSSLLVSSENAVYISGTAGKTHVLAKYDLSLKPIWKLNFSALPESMEIYNGALYVVTEKSLSKVSHDGKLLWEKKLTTDKDQFSPSKVTIAGNQVFVTGMVYRKNGKLGFHQYSFMCDLEGNNIVTHEFKEDNNILNPSFYSNGFFYTTTNGENWVKTKDNKTFVDVDDEATELKTRYEFRTTRLNDPWENAGKFFGANDYYSVETLTSPIKFYSGVLLSDNSVLGITYSDYKAIAFVRTAPLTLERFYGTNTGDVVLPQDALKGTNSESDYHNVLNALIEQIDRSIGVHPQAQDLMALYAERAIAKLASVSVPSGTLVDEALLKEASEKAAKLSQNGEETCNNRMVFDIRPFRKHVTVSLAEKGATLTLDPSVASASVDGLIVEAPELTLYLNANALKEIKANGPLTLSFSKNGAVDYDRGTDVPHTVCMKITATAADSSAILNDSETIIGGNYNPVTGMLEAPFKGSSTFKTRNNPKAFTDIASQSASVKKAISVLSAKGIMGGKTQTTFNPDAIISRAEIAAVLLNITGLMESEGKSKFADVASTDWFYKTAYSASQNGIMNGTGPGTFSPKALINKEQLVTILSQLLMGEMKYVNNGSFMYFETLSDSHLASSWAKESLAFAKAKGLLINYRPSLLDPKSHLTRGETAELIYRFYQKWH